MVNETGFQLKVIIINVYLVTGLHTLQHAHFRLAMKDFDVKMS